jgi:outer membrane protein OmpA-like peptidoglycan-associated protein
MRNVDFHQDDSIVLRIRALQGALLRRNSAVPPAFDDKRSFALRIDSGTIGIRTESLAELMNNYVFAYPKAPLKKIKISAKGNQIRMSAKLDKVIDVPVRIVGDLTPTPEGKIRLHPTSIKAAGIPVKGFMNVFGLDLSEVMKTNEERGVTIDDNDIIMDPERMIPPPAIRGRITAVRVEGDEVIQVFGNGGKAASKGSNYMYYRGGTLRFGKLTMANADLRIVDADPKNAFDFSIDNYNRQLVAGHSKNTPNFGLVVVMPDYYRVSAVSRNESSTTPMTGRSPNEKAASGGSGLVKQFALEGKELFDKPDNARLRKEKLLDEAGAFLQQNPFESAVVVVSAGSTKEQEENVKLSEERAMAVRKYLAKKFKLDDSLIKIRRVEDREQRDGSDGDVAILVYAGRQDNVAAVKRK